MSRFKITTVNGSSGTYEGTYKVFDSGVLAVKTSDGKMFVLSPSAWAQIDFIDAPKASGVDEVLVG